LQGAEDLARLGEAPRVVLREDELAVAQHVELSFAARDVPRWDPVLRQLGRETRSPFVIASSGRAVIDLDGHDAEPTLSRLEE
jgi:hypothetical protein